MSKDEEEKKRRQKRKFYKALLIEFIELLCSLCLYLEAEGSRNHNHYGTLFSGHYTRFTAFSLALREDNYDNV